ncbi:MAG TPA: putative quinol monooxygenase [Patescibacteria group bacterium]|nr:putative quinol monooxygenase [Patescibacteria group bacterium]
MIITTLRIKVRPEKRDEFLKTVRGILEPTRVEPGCIRYQFYQDIENENAFILVEEWETKEDLDRNIHRENYKRLMVLMDLLSEPPEIKINTVSHRAGIEYLEEVLSNPKRASLLDKRY